MKRFWDKVNKTATCWLWTRPLNHGGYGIFTFKRFSWKAHRVAWFLSNGEIPKGKVICHSCDVRHCVNPAHLWIGTRADNNRDMDMKGRRIVRRGKDCFKTKLTEDQVLRIRKLCARGLSHRDIGNKFGVSKRTVQDISARKSWAWL